MTERAYSMRKIQDILEDCILHPLQFSNRTPFIVGSPGIGKTALCHALFWKYRRWENPFEVDPAKRGAIVNPNGFTHFIPYVAPEREATEWGLPMPNADRTAIVMMPLSEFIFNPDDRVFFLLDEIDKANNMMQNVLARLAHERRVYNIVLPKTSFVVMAGNHMTDRAGSVTANSHIKGRRTHLPAMVDHVEWIEDVALVQGYHPAVISFIRAESGFLHKFKPSEPTFPSPRAWSKVGEQINRKTEDHVERALIEGDIGVEAANSFYGHLTIYRDMRDIGEIIGNPDKCKLPEGNKQTAIMWAEVTSLAKAADASNVDQIARYLNRLPGEFSFVGFRDMMIRENISKRSGGESFLVKSKSAVAWMAKNAMMIARTTVRDKN